jgi:hypothetical protein
MEQLDDLLLARHVDLDAEEPRQGAPNSKERAESSERREKLTDSLLRNDVLAPHVIRFTPTYYNPNRKCRRWAALILAVALSIFGLFHFSKVVFSLSHEATLDIETKMATSGYHVNISSSWFNSTTATYGQSSP